MLHTKIDIWQDLPYKGESDDGFTPVLTTYILAGEKKRGLVLILPGGAYAFTSPTEAEPVAMKFSNAGFHTAVLDYSVAPRRHPQSLLDVVRSLTILYRKADEWLIDMEHIYICGFSAGGHLAAEVSNHYLDSWLLDYEGIDIKSLRMKGCILCYPVITSGEFRHEDSFRNLLGDDATKKELEQVSMEQNVTMNTPPTFLWHTFEDDEVPVENTLLYATALRKHNVPFEMHIYPKGGHGLALGNEVQKVIGNKALSSIEGWSDLCIEWMINLS
jgi:acetyl esterase/lipase